jgi:glycosyltransferase involved in cell wall biosynthesis
MKVSIIVPVYNVEKYIDRCLSSLVNQTLKDIEIIVVDDASPDNSKKIIDSYVKKYPKKVRYFYKENGGQGSARNLGLTKAKGDYIAYVDSDDYIEPDMMEKMYNKAISDNSDIVVCGSREVSINGDELGINYASIYNDKDLDILYGSMAVWNKIYKKDILDKMVFREKLWYEDIDFTIKLALSTDKISFVNEPLYNYLVRPGSTMNNTNYKRNLELLDAFDEMIKYFKKKKTYNKNYEKLEFVAFYHIYIMGIGRLITINAPMKDKKEIINKYKEYLNTNFSSYRKNPYIKYMSRNRKIVYRLIDLNLYHTIKFILGVKA